MFFILAKCSLTEKLPEDKPSLVANPLVTFNVQEVFKNLLLNNLPDTILD
jgi:hypothetical protein